MSTPSMRTHAVQDNNIFKELDSHDKINCLRVDPKVISLARTCSCIIIVLDAIKPITHKRMIEKDLEGFGIRNYEIVPRLDEFARILCVPCEGVCMFSPEWSIASLHNYGNPNPIYLTPLDDLVVVRDTIFNERPPTKRHKVKGKEVVPDPFQMVFSEIKIGFRKWETILSENSILLSGNKYHPNACLVYMLYFLASQKRFNLAYYMTKRTTSVIKSDLMVLPYGMLLTCLYRHVLTIQPCPVTNAHYLVDYVMVPLTEGQAHRFTVDGKRPRPQISSGSSSSKSPTPTQ
ncbi:hypothetical protein Tco_0530734 [Tanacetum coccineum]